MKLLKDALDKLTDNYKKGRDSNVGKVFELIFSQLEEVRNAFVKIEEWQDIDKAQGVPLDDLAKRAGEERGQKEDEKFRDFIKLRIRLNRSAGEIETLNEIGRLIFGDGLIGIEEVWYKPELNYEPAALLVCLNDNLQTLDGSAIRRIKGGGVKVYFQLNFEPDRLIATSKQYTFPVPYPTTGTFHTAPINGVAAKTKAQADVRTYSNPVIYPVTGTFYCTPEGGS